MSDLGDTEVHRYVDGDMTPDERRAFETRLDHDEDLARDVAEVLAQNDALRMAIPTPTEAHLQDVLSQAEQAIVGPPRRFAWGQIAAGFAILAFGFGGGMMWDGPASAPQTVMANSVLTSASSAHALYSVELVHPVEVGAGQKDHLKGWLSNRLGSEVRIPDLNAQGLSLVGGRLLPFEHGAAAQFMYEDKDGARVTLYLTPAQHTATTALRFGENKGLTASYWQDGTWHYALVGGFEKSRIRALAQSVQGALY